VGANSPKRAAFLDAQSAEEQGSLEMLLGIENNCQDKDDSHPHLASIDDVPCERVNLETSKALPV
jgi:hypothetical protein